MYGQDEITNKRRPGFQEDPVPRTCFVQRLLEIATGRNTPIHSVSHRGPSAREGQQ
jgi:hypothetical protein